MEADRVSDLIPFLHVTDMEASIDFYEKLGLEVDDTYRQDGRVVCVSMRSGSATLMLAESPGQIEPRGGRHFLYTENLVGLRERLIEVGWRSLLRSRTGLPVRGRQCRCAIRIATS